MVPASLSIVVVHNATVSLYGWLKHMEFKTDYRCNIITSRNVNTIPVGMTTNGVGCRVCTRARFDRTVRWPHWNHRTCFHKDLQRFGMIYDDNGKLADFLNWMPSTEPPDDGAAEDIQESAEAALAATSQGI
jgi:hypothetical protein